MRETKEPIKPPKESNFPISKADNLKREDKVK
jgi:hypothetical protein